jgi:hypothetical protein
MDVAGKPPRAGQFDAPVEDVTVAAFDHAGAQAPPPAGDRLGGPPAGGGAARVLPLVSLLVALASLYSDLSFRLVIHVQS